MKLSELYQPQLEEIYLDLTVLVLNINKGYNESIKRNCKTLQEYMLFVEQTREYEKTMCFEKAIIKAVDTCIQKGILKEFLLKNKAEVVKMSLYEYDEENVKRLWAQDAREDGFEEGRKVEQVNTERERQRADEAEAEILKLREEIARLKEVN